MSDRHDENAMEALAERFLALRPRLHAIAQHSLGSSWSADDAVQETWIRLQRADVEEIEDLGAWLTTVVSRVSIDLIRRSERRHEAPAEDLSPQPSGPGDLADEMMRTEELALAMHVLLDSLGPLERLAVVLHDVFALSFAEIAPILDRTPAAARQLASRARARLRGVDTEQAREQQEGVIEAFLAAARDGDFGGLLQLLDPEIELRSNAAAVDAATAALADGAPPLEPMVRGSDAVARVFAGRMHDVARVLLEGIPAAAYVQEGEMRAVYLLRVRSGRITHIEVFAETEHLAGLQPGGEKHPGQRAQEA